jgi:hypothetical protein
MPVGKWPTHECVQRSFGMALPWHYGQIRYSSSIVGAPGLRWRPEPRCCRADYSDRQRRSSVQWLPCKADRAHLCDSSSPIRTCYLFESILMADKAIVKATETPHGPPDRHGFIFTHFLKFSKADGRIRFASHYVNRVQRNMRYRIDAFRSRPRQDLSVCLFRVSVIDADDTAPDCYPKIAHCFQPFIGGCGGCIGTYCGHFRH